MHCQPNPPFIFPLRWFSVVSFSFLPCHHGSDECNFVVRVWAGCENGIRMECVKHGVLLAWWVTIFFSFQTCKTVCATGALPQSESSESSGEQTDRPCDDLLGFGLLSWNSNLLIKIYLLAYHHSHLSKPYSPLITSTLNFQFWHKPAQKAHATFCRKCKVSLNNKKYSSR